MRAVRSQDHPATRAGEAIPSLRTVRHCVGLARRNAYWIVCHSHVPQETPNSAVEIFSSLLED